ncbi:MAG: hypothetical protein ACOX4H_01810 [Bacillota bacterium]|nr:hypothetical protein [Clostridia bacterium]
MYLKRFGLITIIFAVAWLVSFALSYWVANSSLWQDYVKKPFVEQNLEINQAQAVGMIPGSTKIKEEIYYTKCKHLIQRELTAEEDYPGASEETLKAQGWTIYHNHDGSITIFKTVDKLCPEDAKKRHLGVAGEFVSIIEGPVGVDGEVLEILDIKVANLPKEWQEKVRKGELDFSSEQELLEALDSIDEYE